MTRRQEKYQIYGKEKAGRKERNIRKKYKKRKIERNKEKDRNRETKKQTKKRNKRNNKNERKKENWSLQILGCVIMRDTGFKFVVTISV